MLPSMSVTRWFAVIIALAVHAALAEDFSLPREPVEIGQEPQFVFDGWIVENYWALKYKRQSVDRVFHQPTKHAANPLLTGDDPGYPWVIRDPASGLFRMYYQANFEVAATKKPAQAGETLPGEAQAKGRSFKCYVAYAESKDGVQWERPTLNASPPPGLAARNLAIYRPQRPEAESSAPMILEVPEKDRRGYRYLMLYRTKGPVRELAGIRIAGSHDGVTWDLNHDAKIAHLHSDTANSVCYDPRRGEYVMYCRPKHLYRAFDGEMIDTGESRRVARLASRELWTDWLADQKPQTILVPDEIDNQTHFSCFYAMPTRWHAGVYWGFLEPFRMNDLIYTELVTSRDGIQFQRFGGRPKLLEFGPQGSWDDEMIFASPSWVEVGDEWWIYYSGWDGPHGTADRDGAIGLATIRKEGFASLRGPAGGGVVCTRLLQWDGGSLAVNADARGGKLTVRISDEKRRPIAGFDHADCDPFTGNRTQHEITWSGRAANSLGRRTVHLEFYLEQADLFTFRQVR
jgi:hypothetical protein